MAKWARRMQQIPGYRNQFDPWIQKLLRESNERLAKQRQREAMLAGRLPHEVEHAIQAVEAKLTDEMRNKLENDDLSVRFDRRPMTSDQCVYHPNTTADQTLEPN